MKAHRRLLEPSRAYLLGDIGGLTICSLLGTSTVSRWQQFFGGKPPSASRTCAGHRGRGAASGLYIEEEKGAFSAIAEDRSESFLRIRAGPSELLQRQSRWSVPSPRGGPCVLARFTRGGHGGESLPPNDRRKDARVCDHRHYEDASTSGVRIHM